MTRTQFLPKQNILIWTCCLAIVGASFIPATKILANTRGETWLPFRIIPREAKTAALAKLTFWMKDSSTIEVLYQGGKVTVPLSKIRKASFVWEESSGTIQLTVRDGQSLEVKIENLKADLSAVLRDTPLDVEVKFTLNSIASMELLDVQPKVSNLPPAGSKLLAKTTKDSTESPLVLLGQVDNNNKYNSEVRYSQETLNVSTGGFSLKCPFGSVKSATAKEKELEVLLVDGTTITGEGSPATIKGKFMDMDTTLEKWSRIEFSWQPKDSSIQPSPEGQLRPNSVLIAVITKNGMMLPEFVVAKVNEKGKCVGIRSSSEPTFGLSTNAGDIICPFAKIKSINCQGDQVTVVLVDGTTLKGVAKSTKVTGLMKGQEATIESWSHAEFSWRSESSVSSKATDTGTSNAATPWNKRYYRIDTFPKRDFEIDGFLSTSGSRSSFSPTANYKGAELDVSKECQSYQLNPSGGSVILSDGETVTLKDKLPDYVSLFTEYSPFIPARVVMATANLKQMVSGENAERSTLKQDWEKSVKDTSNAAWSITDLKGHSYIVKNLRGYQHGQGYDSPPPGYYWIGGTPREYELIAGQCAVINMAEAASAHIPLACVEALDATKGLLRLKGGAGTFTEKLRGFAGEPRADINNYMRTKEGEWQRSIIVGDSIFGRLAIAMSNCALIEQTNLPNDFIVPLADNTGQSIRLTTPTGGQTLSQCLVSYNCSTFTDSVNLPASPAFSKAAYWLVLGKDEPDDDPKDYKLAQLVVEIPAGPTLSLPFRIVASGQKQGDLLDIRLMDGKHILGKLTEGSFLGTGILGETSVELPKVDSFEIQR